MGARAQTALAHPRCWRMVGNTRAAWQYLLQTRARAWCRRWCQVGGGGGAGPWSRARALAPGLVPLRVLWVHAPFAEKAGRRLKGGQGWLPRGRGWGGGGGGGGLSCRVPCPPCSPVRQCTPISPSDAAFLGGGGVPWSLSRSHPGGAEEPRRLCPPPYRHSPTSAWGPLSPPGLVSSPGGDPEPSPRPGAPSWAVGV